jgi:hypothetical protein
MSEVPKKIGESFYEFTVTLVTLLFPFLVSISFICYLLVSGAQNTMALATSILNQRMCV